MKFSNFEIRNWRQFVSVQIEFHPKVTIITGANGSGKTTLLKILSQHFGWPSRLLATPVYSKEGVLNYFSGIWKRFFTDQKTNTGTLHHEPNRKIGKDDVTIGRVTYANGEKAELKIPNQPTVQYSLTIERATKVDGLYIDSHRAATTYQQLINIPTNPIQAQAAYSIYHHESISRYNNSHGQYTPTYRMKEALVSMAIFGPGNQFVQRNESVASLFLGFKEVLSKILPPNIGFKDISVRIPDVVIVTDTGEFLIDAASGGLMSLIDLAWQIFLYSHDKAEFVVVFDEPENHLHPSMQRTLIASLLSAFPKAQFIIATHSPFIVSSVKDSSVYVLKYNQASQSDTKINSTVSSIKLDGVNKAGTASEVLRDALGVTVTLPVWAETELQAIIGNLNIGALNPTTLGVLRQQLDAAGLAEYYPDALNAIAAKQ